jgi:hypothetical protein
MILLIVISLFVPWWQLTVGENLIAANVSPFNTNFDFIGNSFTIPLIWAINLSSILYLAAGGIIMLIYSIKPAKQYSKRLLGFSYRKPFYYVVFFVIGLVALTLIIQTMFNLSVPLMGSNEIALPSNITEGVNISVLVSAGFLWPFWLAVVSAGLCIAARLYHKRLLPPSSSAAPAIQIKTVSPPAAPTV